MKNFKFSISNFQNRKRLARLSLSKAELGGFTLIETLVAVGIFSVTVFVILGAFLAMLQAQRKAVFIRQVHDNARFALERMAREIRTADPTTLTKLTGGRKGITFVNARTNQVEYEYLIDPLTGGGRIDRYTNIGGAGCVLNGGNCPVTDPISFTIEGADFNENACPTQPCVRIAFKATVIDPRGRVTTTLDVQTTVSLFTLDL